MCLIGIGAIVLLGGWFVRCCCCCDTDLCIRLIDCGCVGIGGIGTVGVVGLITKAFEIAAWVLQCRQMKMRMTFTHLPWRQPFRRWHIGVLMLHVCVLTVVDIPEPGTYQNRCEYRYDKHCRINKTSKIKSLFLRIIDYR